MTLSTTDSRFSYDGDAVTVAFSFPRKVVEASHLKVYLYDEDDASMALQTLNTHYTFLGSGLANGIYATATITFLTAPGTDKKVVIFRDPTLTQETDFTGESNVLTTLNRKVDLLTMKLQRADDRLDRAILLPDGDFAAGWNNAYPKEEFANAVLAFDSSGEPMPSGGSSSVAVSTAMTPVVQASTLAAARDAMGLEIGADVASQADMDAAEAAIVAAEADIVALETATSGAFTDVASAGTVDLGAISSQLVRLTGTGGPITSFGTVAAGVRKKVRVATGTFVITHHATSLICAANGWTSILTGPDDFFEVESLGSGNWIISSYTAKALIRVEDDAVHSGAQPQSMCVGSSGNPDYEYFKFNFGTERPIFQAQSFWAMSVGDGVDNAKQSLDGNYGAPSTWAGYQPSLGADYAWSPHVSLTVPVAQTPYETGRHAQILYGQLSTPTSTNREGALFFGATWSGQTAPFFDGWLDNGSWVFVKRANKPWGDANVGGVAVANPYTYSNIKNYFSAGDANPVDLSPDAIHYFIVGDEANEDLRSIRMVDALTSGFCEAVNLADNQLIFKRINSGTKTKIGTVDFDDGSWTFGESGGLPSFRVTPRATGTSTVQVTGGDGGGNDAKVDVAGAGSNYDLALLGKGTGGVRIGATTSTVITRLLSTTAAINFGNVPANSYNSSTVTLTGVTTSGGEIILVSSVNNSLDDARFSFDGYISAADTVTVYCRNHSTSDRDPGSQTLRIVAIKF